jgi:molecular chaperone GrpE
MMSNDDEFAEPADESAAEAAASSISDEAIAELIDEQSAADAAQTDAAGLPADQITEEAVVALIAERDEYLDALQRAKAEFANARRRSEERSQQQKAQAAADLVEKLLPILDSCEAGLAQGIEEIRPVSDALFDVLAAQGLERVDGTGESFDPELHEAVMYEEGEGDQVVVENLRTGYRWNDRVLRAAMVKVRG